jgi:serine/threonine protein kinase
MSPQPSPKKSPQPLPQKSPYTLITKSVNTISKIDNINCNNCNNIQDFIKLIKNYIPDISLDITEIEKLILTNFVLNLQLNNITLSNITFKIGTGKLLFNDCKLINVIFDEVDINNSSFINCSFDQVSFINSNLINCNFTNSNLINSTMKDTDLSNSIFHNAKLNNIDIQDSILSNCDYKNANLNKLNFNYSELTIEPNFVENGYTFIKLLGSGGFGEVWKAKDAEGKLVAIKCFNNIDNTDALESEYEALIDISSPTCKEYAVCYIDKYTIKHSISFNNNTYPTVVLRKYSRLIIDYIEGYNLHSIIKISKNIKNNYLLPYCLIKGIKVLHDLGISHQDIKMDNIMFDINSKKFRYIDWGLACLKKQCVDENTCSGYCGSSGTITTMPPELQYNTINDISYEGTIAHDYWSIGVVLLNIYSPNTNNTKFYDFKNQDVLTKFINKNTQNLPTLITSIIKNLLIVDYKKRLSNFESVLYIVNNFDDSLLNPDVYMNVENNIITDKVVIKKRKNQMKYTLGKQLYDITWYKDGQIYRENDLPAYITGSGENYYYKNNELYKIVNNEKTIYFKNNKKHMDDDLPAVIFANGDKEWFKNDKRHRENDLPAVEKIDGTREWWVNGERHREGDLPAAVFTNGDKYWFKNDKKHRDNDLPAVIFATGDKYWFIDDKKHRENDLPAVEKIDGTREWWFNGKKHREGDLPAIIFANGDKHWFKNDKKHRDDDLPAAIFANGNKQWFKNDKRHRENDLPAVEKIDGTREWWVNGERHREGGLPAAIFANGDKFWFINGKKHREDGLPAVDKIDGTREWWINGIKQE